MIPYPIRLRVLKQAAKPKDDVLRFYEWMQSFGNKYLTDNERMVRAFEIVANNK